MSLFKQRKNKSFNYRPRFQESNKIETKEEFEAKWNEVKETTKRRGSIFTTLPGLLIMLVAILILMYVLNTY